MFWSQDIVISVLFPYMLPSVGDSEWWQKKNFKSILECTMMLLCNISYEKTQGGT